MQRFIAEGAESTFDAVLSSAFKDAAASKIPFVYFLLSAGLNEAGISWCPDCRLGQPLAIEAVAKKNAIYIEAVVSRAEWRGVDSNPYKIHPVLKATRLPTLYKFADGQLKDVLIEEDVYNVEKLNKFVE